MTTRADFAALVLDDLERHPEAAARVIQAGLIAAGHDLGPSGVDGRPGDRTTGAWLREVRGEGAPALAVDRTFRLPADQYLPDATPKSLLVLHHTVGGSWRSTFDWWRTTPERIGTAYLVERDGKIFEVFDPRSWAYHLGLKGVGNRVDRRAIGVEICSEGGLIQAVATGELHAFGVASDRTIFRGESLYTPWRGFHYFADYTRPALDSVVRLVDRLCSEHGIPRRTPADHLSFDRRLFDFEGIVGHHHLRADKSDVHPGFPWAELVERCGLELVP